MKTSKTLLLLGLSIGIISSCAKKDNDSDSSTKPTDLNGVYTGSVEYKDLYADGTVIDEGTLSDVTVTATGSGTSYNLAIDAPGADPGTISVTVSGSAFSGTNGTGLMADTKVNGNLSGNTMTLNYDGNDGEYAWKGTFSGNRPASSGGGGNGGTFAGPADYNSGSINVTVNGQSFSLTDCSGGIYSGQLAIAGDGLTDGELELNVIGISGSGTYDINVFTWSDDRPNSLWDTVEKTVSDAVTITSIDADKVIGTIDFSSDGLTMKGTFTLNK